MAEGIVRARYRESLTQADVAEAGRGVPVRDRSGGHLGRVPEGPPHPRARDQQPLSAVRSQSEHGSRLRHHGCGQGREADGPPRRRACLARRAAGDSTPALRSRSSPIVADAARAAIGHGADDRNADARGNVQLWHSQNCSPCRVVLCRCARRHGHGDQDPHERRLAPRRARLPLCAAGCLARAARTSDRPTSSSSTPTTSATPTSGRSAPHGRGSSADAEPRSHGRRGDPAHELLCRAGGLLGVARGAADRRYPNRVGIQGALSHTAQYGINPERDDDRRSAEAARLRHGHLRQVAPRPPAAVPAAAARLRRVLRPAVLERHVAAASARRRTSIPTCRSSRATSVDQSSIPISRSSRRGTPSARSASSSATERRRSSSTCRTACRTCRSSCRTSSRARRPADCMATSSPRSTGRSARFSTRCEARRTRRRHAGHLHLRQRTVAVVRQPRRFGRTVSRGQGHGVRGRRARAVRGPLAGAHSRGSRRDALPAMTIDLLPTIAKLAGAPVSTERIIDGRDIWPLIAGQRDAQDAARRVLLLLGHRAAGDPQRQVEAASRRTRISRSRWPGHDGMPGEYERKAIELSLFDLDQDPGEVDERRRHESRRRQATARRTRSGPAPTWETR